MSTVPFVKRPLLSNQAHMCLSATPKVCLCVCIYRVEILGMLAEEMECLLVCVCVCGCVHMFGAAGVSDESRTLPQYFACVYICLNVWWHPAGIRPVPACSCQRRARNALPQHNCPNTSPSAVSPLSCQDEITSRGFIFLFISPRPGPSSHIGIVARVPPTPAHPLLAAL